MDDKENFDEIKRLLNYSPKKNSATEYDVVSENGQYFIKEKIVTKKSDKKDNEIVSQSLKAKFTNWYSSVAPPAHQKWFRYNLKSRINELDNKYYASFYKKLFEIDLENIDEEITIIHTNLRNRLAVPDKPFENYIRMTHGMAKEVIIYYIDYLKNRNFEN